MRQQNVVLFLLKEMTAERIPLILSAVALMDFIA